MFLQKILNLIDSSLLRHKYEMHSKYSLDIDSEIDFKLAEVMLDYES